MVAELLIVILVIAILGVLFGTKVGKKIRLRVSGTADEAINKDATTPEGAKAYYNVAISKKEENYNKANQLYAEITGKLEAAKKEEFDLKKDLIKLGQDIEKCVTSGKDDDAFILLKQEQAKKERMEVLKSTISEMEATQKAQEDIRDLARTQLMELKEEKDKVVYQLESDQKIIEIHQSMDSLSSNNESDKMLQKVRDGAKKTREKATGTKIAYQTSTEATDRRLEKEAKDREVKAALEELKRKKGIK